MDEEKVLNLPKIGDTVKIRSNGKVRVGKVVYINWKHLWATLEFEGRFRDYYTGEVAKYRECIMFSGVRNRNNPARNEYGHGAYKR